MKFPFYSSACAAAILVSSLAAIQPLHAAEQVQDVPQASEEDIAADEEIVVTAQGRAQTDRKSVV